MSLWIIGLSKSKGIMGGPGDQEPFSLSKGGHRRNTVFLFCSERGAPFLLLSIPDLHLFWNPDRFPEMANRLHRP